MTAPTYKPWASDIELSFYATLGNLKIEKDKLDDSARRVLGLYEVRPGEAAERSARMQIQHNSLVSDVVPKGFYRAEGWIKNYNTLEEYKSVDRTKVLELAGKTIWDAIKDETIYSIPSLLSSFYAISFANLKKYKFTTHFAYPALHLDVAYSIVETNTLNKDETELLVDAVQTWRYSVDPRQQGFFLAKRTLSHDGKRTTISWQIASLEAFKKGFFDGIQPTNRFIAFADPSTYANGPAWMLRNYLVMIRQLWKLDNMQILCYRDTHALRHQTNSIILHLKAETLKAPPPSHMPKVTGWERINNKLTSRTIDLGAFMDPTKLADQAVDLNLKLIKWRIAPSLDLDIIKNTSCLLLGAGTLGSYVARNLMGWGVRKITFLDSATVSFSNPVRQPLYRYEDCLDGGKAKAIRAAEALKEIYPGVESRGEVLNVPMVGHPMIDEAKTKEDFEKVKALIAEHDAIFLLLDSRESRWLPTLMGKSANKIVLNAALGFESYVVLRQGVRATKPEHVEVGCYFCNDVVAPADSLKDATLDQQCTVTRPGIAPIASALLVELLISILQHPLKAHAPPPAPPTSSTSNPTHPTPASLTSQDTFVHPLGTVPQQLRGSLSDWSIRPVVSAAFSHCSACSKSMLDAYERDDWEFVRRALGEKGWVEEVSGLAEIQRKALAAADDVEWESDGELGEEGDGELL